MRQSGVPLRLISLAAFLVLGCLNSSAADTGKRWALVVGNSAYSASPLRNPVNDATAMENVLREADFQVIGLKNATKEAMYKAIGDFTRSLGPEDTALFFYAGHAVQIEGENVLIPVDFSAAATLFEAKGMMVSLGAIMDELKRRRPKRSIVIIDACRINPIAQKYDLPVGLAEPMNLGNETYIAFSTSHGKTAKDNPDGTNSWFTEALAELIPEPRVTLDEIFTRVRRRVQSETGGDQVPESFTKLTTTFYFHGSGDDETDDAQLRQKRMLDAERHEKWGDWSEAMAIMERLGAQGSDDLAARAKRRLPYLSARKKASELFEQHDFAGAGAAYDQALQEDPFAMDAAVEAVNSYLLCDRLPDAVRVLGAMRLRAPSQTVDLADAMLRELAAVSAEAKKESESPRPDPVPIQQIFRNVQFGVPDFDAGKRYLQTGPVDLSKQLAELAKRMSSPEPRPSEPETSAGESQEPFSLAGFHVEVMSVAGDRVIGIAPANDQVNDSGVTRPSALQLKVTTDPPGMELTVEDDREQQCASPCIVWLSRGKHTIQAAHAGYRTENRVVTVPMDGGTLEIRMEQEFGFVKLTGAEQAAAVLLDGRQVAQQLPHNLKLPTGRYKIRAVQDGKELKSGDVAVKAGEVIEVPVGKQQP
jgi:hypothetical protein